MHTRRRPGEIRDAIIDSLEQLGGEATLAQLQEAVNNRVGTAVSASSVRSYLRLNTPSLFVRMGRGRYGLASTDLDQLDFVSRAPEEVYRTPMTCLYQGNCLDWIHEAPTESLQAVVTDPPYGLVEYTEQQQTKLRNGKGGVWRIPPAFDGHKRSPLPRFTTLSTGEVEELEAFFFGWSRALRRVLVPGAHVIVASNPLLSYVVAHAIVRAGFERRGEIIRLVRTMRGGDRPKNAHAEFSDVSVMPRSMWEPWLLFRKPIEGRVQDNLRKWKTGGLRRISGEKPFGDVIVSHPTRATERKLAPHPSLKPQEFLRQVVRAVLPLGEGSILDPFAGSGSTLAAATAVGYKSIGIELDPGYATMACDSIPRLTGL